MAWTEQAVQGGGGSNQNWNDGNNTSSSGWDQDGKYVIGWNPTLHDWDANAESTNISWNKNNNPANNWNNSSSQISSLWTTQGTESSAEWDLEWAGDTVGQSIVEAVQDDIFSYGSVAISGVASMTMIENGSNWDTSNAANAAFNENNNSDDISWNENNNPATEAWNEGSI